MADTDVSGQLAVAGMAFGDLVKLTGQAVSDAQQTLNKTAAASTSTLARTLVDVIAVQETDYDDDGNVTGATSFTQKLPLIDFVDPVLYQWTEVRLQGRFLATQFSATSATDTSSGHTADDAASTGPLIFLGAGFFTQQFDATSTQLNTDVRTESSVGLIRMNAILDPRHDIGVPPPRRAIVGPRIQIDAGPIQDVGPAAAPTGRTMEAIITFTRDDGAAIANKELSIDTPGVGWAYKAGATTDANGQVTAVLSRSFVGATPDRSPIGVVVSVRKGLVGESATLTF
jgi:hypothetical protein